MKTLEKVSFSKFFPAGQQYIVIQGRASSPDDFDLTIDIGDGQNKSSFYLDPWANKGAAELLKSMRDATQQALEFYEKALNLPSMPDMVVESKPKLWTDIFSSKAEKKESKPVKKAAAKKKKASTAKK